MKGTDLFSDFSQFFFLNNQVGGKDGENECVTGVTKHDGKEERESNDSVQARVYFTVCGNAVSIDQRLKAGSKFVGSEKCGWILVRIQLVKNWYESAVRHFLN